MNELKINVNSLKLEICFKENQLIPQALADSQYLVKEKMQLGNYLVYNQKGERILTVLKGMIKRNNISICF